MLVRIAALAAMDGAPDLVPAEHRHRRRARRPARDDPGHARRDRAGDRERPDRVGRGQDRARVRTRRGDRGRRRRDWTNRARGSRRPGAPGRRPPGRRRRRPAQTPRPARCRRSATTRRGTCPSGSAPRSPGGGAPSAFAALCGSRCPGGSLGPQPPTGQQRDVERRERGHAVEEVGVAGEVDRCASRGRRSRRRGTRGRERAGAAVVLGLDRLDPQRAELDRLARLDLERRARTRAARARRRAGRRPGARARAGRASGRSRWS